MEVRLIPVTGLPEVRSGDNLAALLLRLARFETGDVLVLAQKIVSKAEGRTVALSSVAPSEEALRLAAETEKDPRVVQLTLEESRQVLRARVGALIVEDRRGWVCANAGIDRSNVPQAGGEETVLLLPRDPDASCLAIRRRIEEGQGVPIGVVIADSHGRAWREGTVGVAIGASGVTALADRRGEADRDGYLLQHTTVGVADELAAAGSLVMGQGAESVPAVIIRGVDVLGEGRAADLQRPRDRDLFR